MVRLQGIFDMDHFWEWKVMCDLCSLISHLKGSVKDFPQFHAYGGWHAFPLHKYQANLTHQQLQVKEANTTPDAQLERTHVRFTQSPKDYDDAGEVA